MPDLPTPQAARLQRPSWKDWRLLVGVLLVLLAVVLGSRVVAAADDTAPVYVAAHPLVPGQPVTDDDLTIVQAHLEDVAPTYVDASRPLAAHTYALRPVRQGELVPDSALGGRSQVGVKTLTVPVDPAVAQVLAPGSVVDVWVNGKKTEAGTDTYGTPRKVLDAAVVAGVPDEDRLLGSATTAVQIEVPDDRVEALIAAVDREDKITLVPVAGSRLKDGS